MVAEHAYRRRIATARGAIECLISEAGAQAPVVLLLHPLASAGDLWVHALARLSDRGFRAIAPTLPGPAYDVPGEAPLSIAAMAEDVIALVDALDVAEASIVGMSMGGCIALQLALCMPRRVCSLVLVDTTSCYGEDRLAKWEERARSAERSAREDLLAFQLDRWFSDAFRAQHAAEAARIAGIFVACPKAVHADCCRALGAFDLSSRLPEIDVPALIIVGEHDYATPPVMSETLARGLPRAILRVLPGVRHMSIIEAPRAWEQVCAFLTTPHALAPQAGA